MLGYWIVNLRCWIPFPNTGRLKRKRFRGKNTKSTSFLEWVTKLLLKDIIFKDAAAYAHIYVSSFTIAAILELPLHARLLNNR
jgi:hypothetical protein